MSTPVSYFGFKRKYSPNVGVDQANTSKTTYFPSQANDAVNENYVVDIAATYQVPGEKIEDGGITTAKLQDNCITTDKIGDLAIQSATIANTAITSDKITDASITTQAINDASVTETKIADGGVDAQAIADGAITNAKIGPNTLTSTAIADGAVTTEKIGDGGINMTKFTTGCITADTIQDGAVTLTKLQDASITVDKIQPPINFDAITLTTGTFAETTTFYNTTGDIVMKMKIDTPTLSGSGTSEFAIYNDQDPLTTKHLLFNNSNSTAGDGNYLEYATAEGIAFQWGMQDQGTNLTLFQSAADTFDFAQCMLTGTPVFRIQSDGSWLNTNGSYDSFCDNRLKKDIVPAKSQWNDMKRVKLVSYKLAQDWKQRQLNLMRLRANKVTGKEKEHILAKIKTLETQQKQGQEDEEQRTQLGVIAQDLEVSGMKGLVDESRYGVKNVKQSILIMKALVAIQEAIKTVEELETWNENKNYSK